MMSQHIRKIKPEYSKRRVDQAGENIKNDSETIEDLMVVENWRASHNKILNDWQASLRGRIKNKDIVFAQRLKRRNTIFDKLKRQPTMKLSRMHDIAGCRLIFEDIKSLHHYRDDLHNNSYMRHERRKADEKPYPYDYIDHPHPDNSGYRGIHDIYKYMARPKRDSSWNDLLVEIQYRTKNQHAWATAVEIAGQITGNESKFGRGDESQKEFFRLTSEIIARAHEGMTSCYPDYKNGLLVTKFSILENDLKLLKRLESIKMVGRVLGEKVNFNKKNVILVMPNDSDENGKLDVFTFKSLPEATRQYFEFERRYGESMDIVLVRAASKESLHQAYRNYFSDTKDFVRLVRRGLTKLNT